LRYIHNHYTDPSLRVNDVVAATDRSRRDLEKAFRRELKRTVNHEVVRVRMNKVKNLLVTTDMKVVEISAATGFARTNHFFRTFRKLVGLSPRTYRARKASVKRPTAARSARGRRTGKFLKQAAS